MAILKAILEPEVQKFIREYQGDITKLAFAGSPFPNILIQVLLEQISSRKQIKSKLPLWYNTPNIYYSPKLNLEQTSSEITAKHKSNYIKGDTLADLTGGFGIDCYYFSLKMNSVTHLEQNESLSEIAKHNFLVLNAKNVTCKTGNSLELLEGKYDTIYADPGRRTENKNKVFLLEDCLPNIPKYLNHILNHTNFLMLKTSPMLDIKQGLSELEDVTAIHILAVNNEVKELLWFIETGSSITEPKIFTFNYTKENVQTFESNLNDDISAAYDKPLNYIYEPNAAILKSGAFNKIANQLEINKIAPNSHLYTSESLIDFPGRRFEVIQVLPYHKKEMRKFNKRKANITTRNFKESVAQIRNKWKIKDGGEDYLFFTTLQNNDQVVIQCKAIK